MSDAEVELVRKARNGDRMAFEELIRRTSRLVFARLYLEIGDAHRAEDLLQETLIRAYRSLSSLAEPSKFRAWLLTVAVNVAVDAQRSDLRQKRATVGPGGVAYLPQLVDSGANPADQAEHNEMRDQVLAVLRSLPEEYRLPLSLRYLAGADYETIQTQLGLSNGSLRGLLHRGLKLLRDRLPPELAEHA
jgi:RNA polymerase sigma-70 factor (ECF subfamily)